MTAAPRARAGRKGRKTPRPLRWTRVLVAIVLALAAIPALLVPLYAFVNPVSVTMAHTYLAEGPITRHWVGLDEMARPLVIAVMASEDTRFCAHHGIDWGELYAVITEPGGPSRGASTIAMQTSRNLFLGSGLPYLRKAIELPLALYADFIWGKHRTMEIYLNIAQWGPRTFGIEAAAEAYFDRPASDLTPEQAALLAAALPNPLLRDPGNPSPAHQSVARRIASRAARMEDHAACLYP